MQAYLINVTNNNAMMHIKRFQLHGINNGAFTRHCQHKRKSNYFIQLHFNYILATVFSILRHDACLKYKNKKHIKNGVIDTID